MAVGGSLSHLGEPSNRANMAYLSLSNTVWCFPFLWNILRNCLNHWPTLKLFLCACACRHVCMVHTCRKKDNFGESVFPSTTWTSEASRTQGLSQARWQVCWPAESLCGSAGQRLGWKFLCNFPSQIWHKREGTGKRSPKKIASVKDTLIHTWLQKLFTQFKDESDAISVPFLCKK